jgi:hypothetical protein
MRVSKWLRYCIFALERWCNVSIVNYYVNMVLGECDCNTFTPSYALSSGSRCDGFSWVIFRKRSWNSAVGLATRMRISPFGPRIPAGASGSSAKHPDRLWGPHILLFSGYLGYFSGAKRPWCDVDPSLPSSAEVKHQWSCTSAPVHAFVSCVMTTVPFKSVCGHYCVSFVSFPIYQPSSRST